MSFEGTDLRDALDPLAGDPVKDAAVVLEGLPRPGIPPVAWWLLAAGLLAGLVSGPWIFGGTKPAERTPIVDQDGKKTDEKKPDDGDKGTKEEEKRPVDEMEKWADVMFHGFGKVVVRRDGQSEELSDRHMVAYGSTFETGGSQAGMLLAYDVQLRLDNETVVRVDEPVHVTLSSGQIWVYSGDAPDGMVAVKTPGGLVDVIDGAANIDYRAGRLQVLCLSGEVEIHPAGRNKVLALAPDTMGTITVDDQDGPARVPFAASYTSWMTRLVLQQEDGSELQKRIAEMVDAYFGREHRAAAERELIRLGAACVPALVERYRNTAGLTQEFSRKTATLVCNMASQSTKKWVFDLLYDKDPEIRVIAYTRAYQITGQSEGTGDTFWRREDNAKERHNVIQKWWLNVR